MSWIYLIREGETGPIKIGRSSDPWKRLDTLQSGNARQLHIICAFRVGKAAHIVERNAHREYIAHRMIGEWYEPIDAIVDLAKAHGRPSCERCDGNAHRLHVWQAHYGVEPIAICFSCLNALEAAKIRAEEERGARDRAEREAKAAAGRRN